MHVAFRARFQLLLEAKGTEAMKGDVVCIGKDIDAHIFSVETSNGDGLLHHESDPLGKCNMMSDFRLVYRTDDKGYVSMRRVGSVTDADIRGMSFL